MPLPSLGLRLDYLLGSIEDISLSTALRYLSCVNSPRQVSSVYRAIARVQEI